MTLAPLLLALGARRAVRALLDSGFDFDVIDAHYFYPDGVAAALIGRALDKPVVVTARGSDLNVIAQYRWPRRQIRWAARRSAQVVTVSQALKERLVGIGVDRGTVSVLRNGVDLQLFHPADRSAARRRVGFESKTLLSVGNLIESKGHHIAIRALAALPDLRLAVVGEGELKEELRRTAELSGVAERVTFVGSVSQGELRHYYSAADALVLASSREGMPNVVLESLACGTPVICTPVGGIPEVVSDPAAGELMAQRDPESLVEAYRRLVAQRPSTEATRRYAERFDWGATTSGQLRIFSSLRPADR
jgi:glycosyltransferase involved in cell wall biosynthesis